MGDNKNNSAYSRWASDLEIKSSLHKVNLNDGSASYGGIPFYSDSEAVYVEKDDVHTLIIGSTGSKKTRLIGMPSLYMYALAGESFIASDPKGELYNKIIPMLKERGYNIFVLNLRDPLKSGSWNPLLIPYSLYRNGFQDKANELVTDMANCIVKNDSERDPYWPASACNLLVGLILILFECAEENEINLKSLRTLRAQAFSGHEAENGTFIKGEGSTLIREEFLKYIDKSSRIYPLLSGTTEVCDVTRGCIVSVFDQAMQPFFSQDTLIDMLSGNDIDMGNIGKAKTAVFLITPDENTIYHCLISVFVKQCYTMLIHEAQKLESNKLPRRVNFLLDEFSSLPQIGDFPAMIAASRSRNIRFNLIIQSLSQLTKRYGREAETIKGNCENWIFLHSRELQLLNEIIELCGKKNADEQLVSISKLQTMDKDTGEVFFLLKRNYPFIGNLTDIDQYPLITSKRKRVKFPVNKNRANSVFNFEAYCIMASPESLSKLFSNKKEKESAGGVRMEPEKIEDWDKYCNERVLGFLTGLSALTNKYGLVIQGCGDCSSPSLSISKGGCVCVYNELKYNRDTGGYQLPSFEAWPENNGGHIDEGEFPDYLKRQKIKCGRGWYGLVMTILVKTRRFNYEHPYEQIKIGCFKEKHGKLHIAGLGAYPDSLKDIFENAKKASAGVCEFCGGTGELKKCNNGEHKTLCPDCTKIHEEAVNRKISGDNGEGRINNRKKSIDEKMRLFLSELSDLTRKYEVSVCGSFGCGKCQGVSDTGSRDIVYKNLEYNNYTGRYTAEGFGQGGNDGEPEQLHG